MTVQTSINYSTPVGSMAESFVKLQPVSRSPATLQYLLPKPTANGRPLYKRRFYPNEEAKQTLSQPWLAATDPMMPPYPYGKNHYFDEANHGLYGGKTIQSGNKISDGRNKGKTLRKWYPNVRVEKLKSRALNVEMSIPTVARVMRTIQKCGGLDEYLLGEKPARIKELGLLGWKLRWLVMKSNAMKERHNQERLKLGLSSTLGPDATFADVWADPGMKRTLIEKMHAGWQQLKEKDAKFLKHWKGDKDGVREMKSLRIYDPKETPLPEHVEEEFIDLPNVQTGFGIIEMPTGKGSQVVSTPPPNDTRGKAVNKAPGKKHEPYKGGEGSAVASRTVRTARTERVDGAFPVDGVTVNVQSNERPAVSV